MTSVAIANGKGGVGKTSLSISLAISLAEHGHSTLLVDADLGLANIDLILGLKPQSTLRHIVRDGVAVSDAIEQGPEGVGVLPGGTGAHELIGMSADQLCELYQKISDAGSKYDFVVYDTASGLDENVMTFLRGSKRVLIVATPDPTSVMDAYATAKILYESSPGANVALVVNMADSHAQGVTVYGRFKSIAGQFLNKDIELAGIVPFDPAVGKALRARQAFVLSAPKCKASISIDGLVEWLTSADEKPAVADERVSLLQRMRSVFAAFKKTEKDLEDEPTIEQAA